MRKYPALEAMAAGALVRKADDSAMISKYLHVPSVKILAEHPDLEYDRELAIAVARLRGNMLLRSVLALTGEPTLAECVEKVSKHESFRQEFLAWYVTAWNIMVRTHEPMSGAEHEHIRAHGI